MERLRGTCISIHASAREATRGATFQADHKIISIHASAREATADTAPPVPDALFQSTPPRGRRRIQTLFCSCFHTISIHASAREATKPKSTGLFTYIISIHASAREATHLPCSGVHLVSFQSTPPRGRRHVFLQVRPGRSYFNPRLREGGDPKRYLSHIFFPISIHASAREATALITNFYI